MKLPASAKLSHRDLEQAKLSHRNQNNCIKFTWSFLVYFKFIFLLAQGRKFEQIYSFWRGKKKYKFEELTRTEENWQEEFFGHKYLFTSRCTIFYFFIADKFLLIRRELFMRVRSALLSFLFVWVSPMEWLLYYDKFFSSQSCNKESNKNPNKHLIAANWLNFRI